jgi:hypothetical protein
MNQDVSRRTFFLEKRATHMIRAHSPFPACAEKARFVIASEAKQSSL